MCEIASTRVTNCVRFGNIGTIAHCSIIFKCWYSHLI